MSEGLGQEKIDSQENDLEVGALEEQGDSHYNLKVKDILFYLLGRREAILKVARNSSSLWYGVLFVFFAGIAREYDQELISKNLEIYFIPFAASAIMILWIMLWFQINTRTLSILLKQSQMQSFFTLFWMTGPLAFLYAFPVEEFFTSMDAVNINLSLLTLVALWRVFLFGRVLHVCTGVNFYAPLITACCVVAYPSLMFKYISIVGVMSGSALSPEQEVLRNFTGASMGGVSISFFVSLPVTLWQFVMYKKEERGPVVFPDIDQKGRVSWVFIVLASLISCLALMYFQPKLNTHHKFTSLVRQDKYHEALDFAQDLNRDDFVKTRPLIIKYTHDEGIYLMVGLQDTHPLWLKEVVYNWTLKNMSEGWSKDEALLALLNKEPLLESDLEFLKANKEVFNEFLFDNLPNTKAKSYDKKKGSQLIEVVSNFVQYGIISDKNLKHLKQLQNQ